MSAWDEITDEERASLPARTRIAHGLSARPERGEPKSGGGPFGKDNPSGNNPNLSEQQFWSTVPTATDIASGRAPSPYSPEGIAAAKARYGKSS